MRLGGPGATGTRPGNLAELVQLRYDNGCLLAANIALMEPLVALCCAFRHTRAPLPAGRCAESRPNRRRHRFVFPRFNRLIWEHEGDDVPNGSFPAVSSGAVRKHHPILLCLISSGCLIHPQQYGLMSAREAEFCIIRIEQAAAA